MNANPKILPTLSLLLLLLWLAACTASSPPLVSLVTPTPLPTWTTNPTISPSPTQTNTPRPTFNATTPPTATPSPTHTATATASPTRRPSSTPFPSSTPTPTATASATLTPAPSPTLSFTVTTTALLTVSLPPTLTQILTATVTVTAPLTPTATPEPNATPLPNLADAPVTLPILMYHYISIPPADADIYRRDLSISPANFEAQMAYLQAEGYTSISPDDLLYHLARQTPLPEKPLLITFDDGYRDNYTNAFPILQKYGFHGTFSLVTDPIDFNDDRYLTWAQVQEMHQAGMDFGAHTRRHLDLRQRSLEFLEDEVLTSKQKIEAQLNVPITFFVYPAGRYDARTLSAVREWFWLAVTTQYGASHRYAERYELSRIRIEGEDTLEIFATKLEALR